jgi:inosose dehydratase
MTTTRLTMTRAAIACAKAHFRRPMTACTTSRLARDVRLAYHHPMGAYVETPEDVDRLMSVTDDEVGLVHDTGHVTFAGGDAPTGLVA